MSSERRRSSGSERGTIADSSAERKIGYPHGAFNRAGRWIPDGTKDYLVEEVIRDMLWVRRHNNLSPADYLLRLKNYPRADVAAGLLGAATIGAMAGLEKADEWADIPDSTATDAGCWIIHCGSPYVDHYWRETGHWVPREGKPIWERR